MFENNISKHVWTNVSNNVWKQCSKPIFENMCENMCEINVWLQLLLSLHGPQNKLVQFCQTARNGNLTVPGSSSALAQADCRLGGSALQWPGSPNANDERWVRKWTWWRNSCLDLRLRQNKSCVCSLPFVRDGLLSRSTIWNSELLNLRNTHTHTKYDQRTWEKTSIQQ